MALLDNNYQAEFNYENNKGIKISLMMKRQNPSTMDVDYDIEDQTKKMNGRFNVDVQDNQDTGIKMYHFMFNDGNNVYWYNEKGFTTNRQRGYKSGFFQYSLICDDDLIEQPKWLDNAIFYQIFPERFCNGDSNNDPKNLTQWGKLPQRDSFFGGDLAGVYEKLDYIEDLGVNAIYLTPIFQSPTNHKYNIDDYMKIDKQFGDKNIFKKLVDDAHRRGIKIILDAVFNHSGYNFFAFKDLREKGKDSKYKNWYIYDSLPLKTERPVNYETFARNIPTLPKMDTSDKEVQDYLLRVTKYWTKEFEIDGWRLDVADEVDPSFWRRFRKTVKNINPEAYIIGEAWHSGLKWLQGDQFDGTMNYSFANAIIDFFGAKNIGPTEFDARLTRNRMRYKSQISTAMLNLIDSHDTPRLLHYCNENIDAMKLAVLFQMTYQGIPMVLYGDELGITGGEEPDSRRCMPWNKVMKKNNLLDYYKKLIKIRKELKPLQNGSFKPLIIDEAKNIYCFSRTNYNNRVDILINNSPVKRSIDLKKEKINKEVLKDKLTDDTYDHIANIFTIELEPYQGKILI
jgi:glycosidase